MRRLFVVGFILIIAGFFAVNFGCKTALVKKNSPEYVAVQFLKHIAKFELDEARKLGNDNTNRMIDMLDMLVELSKEKGADSVIQKKEFSVEVVKVAVDGSKAVVTYKNGSGGEQTLDLVREKGKWLVDMKKEMPNLDSLPKINNKNPDNKK